MTIRLSPSDAEQSGLDAFLTAAYGFLPEVAPGHLLGFDFGLRLRSWQVEKGSFPDTTHAGIVVAAHYEGPAWAALFEAGLMAIAVGAPSTLGVHRDASTLRLRASYRFEASSLRLIPWLEFFHTHRNYFASSLVAGENSLFIDEASLLLGLGVEL